MYIEPLQVKVSVINGLVILEVITVITFYLGMLKLCSNHGENESLVESNYSYNFILKEFENK